jgi:histidyl-tRNA synthetase
MLRAVRGTHDVWPAEVRKYDAVASVFKSVARTMGFSEIRTPVMELTSVFQRSLGQNSDVVSKEMFLLRSRNTDVECLRPEATARQLPAARARCYVRWGDRQSCC